MRTIGLSDGRPDCAPSGLRACRAERHLAGAGGRFQRRPPRKRLRDEPDEPPATASAGPLAVADRVDQWPPTDHDGLAARDHVGLADP